MSELQIEIRKSDKNSEVAILSFIGDLDFSAIEKIGRSSDLMLKENFVFGIADMSGVSDISSPALGELMGCRTSLVERGGDLVLAGLNIALREKLTAMDANKVFRFFSDVRSSENAYNWEYHNTPEKIELTFPSSLKFVPPVRQMASRIARQKGYGNRDSFRIETIVDEICNNAVEHGIDDEKSNIEITLVINRKKIEIKVKNMSNPGKLDSLKEITKSLFVPKVLNDNVTRGRGLALVKMLSNDFEIEYSDVGTCVHVTKLREE